MGWVWQGGGKHTIKRGQLKVSVVQFLRSRKLPKINSCWDWDAPHVSTFHHQIIKCLKLSHECMLERDREAEQVQISTYQISISFRLDSGNN